MLKLKHRDAFADSNEPDHERHQEIGESTRYRGHCGSDYDDSVRSHYCLEPAGIQNARAWGRELPPIEHRHQSGQQVSMQF